jgi:hypothetical protein
MFGAIRKAEIPFNKDSVLRKNMHRPTWIIRRDIILGKKEMGIRWIVDTAQVEKNG